MNIISLDVFDTAIKRKVYMPKDIFNLVESIVGNDFKIKRINAEDKARKENLNYNIYDIYKNLPEFDPEIEINTEINNCEPNKEIKDLYDLNINNGTKFLFISDMYLGHDIIKKMLEKCGYTIDNNLFVSCDHGCLKGNGDLFRRVQEILNIKIDKHYGDNYYADILGSKKVGISSYFITALHNKPTNTPNIENVIVKKILVENEYSDKSIEYKIGFYLAPAIYEFTKSVLNSANNNNNIFFNARDGYLPYIIARDILKTDKNIKYMKFSRRSTLITSLDKNYDLKHKNNILQYNFLRYHRCNTLKDFLISIDILNDNNWDEIFNELNIKDGLNLDIRPSSGNQDIFEKFIFRIQSYIYNRAEKLRANILKYISKIGLKNGDLFVDIGYNGTIQNAIESISGIKLEGKYFQILYNNVNPDLNNINRTQFLKNELLRGVQGVIETIFSAPEGGVYSYNDEGTPLLYDDKKNRIDFTNNVHKGVLDCCKILYNNNINTSIEDIEIIIEKLFREPTLEQANYGNKNIFENGIKDCLESIVWYNEDMITTGSLHECYNRSYWREAFIKLLENSSRLSHLSKLLIPPTNNKILNNTYVKNLLSQLEYKNEKFMIYGCGELCKEIIKNYPKIINNKNFIGFIDRNYNNINTFYGKRVFNPEEIDTLYPNIDIYLTVIELNNTFVEIPVKKCKLHKIYN